MAIRTLEARLKDILRRLVALERKVARLPTSRKLPDTDWVSLGYASGFTAGTAGDLAYRVRGGVVYIRGGAQGVIESGVYQIVSKNPIPPEYRPAQHYRTGGMGSSMRGYCGIEINASDGHVRLGWNNSGTTGRPAWFAAGCSYPVEKVD